MRTSGAVSLIATLLVATACQPARSTARIWRADVVVRLGHDGPGQQMFAIADPPVLDWVAQAAATGPTGRTPNAGMAAYGTNDATRRPTLFVVNSDRTGVRISTFRLNVVEGDPLPAVAPRPDVCAGANWVAAFYVDGVGPVPEMTATLNAGGDGLAYRLRVDPRHTIVRGRAAFRLTKNELIDPDRPIDLRSVRVEPSPALGPMTVLMLTRRGAEWTGASGSAVTFGGAIGATTVDELRIYLLRRPPAC